MKISLITADEKQHDFPDANAAFYTEVTDTFSVHVGGQSVFEVRMGEITELEIFTGTV